jgi:hypothetical protein
MTGVLWSACVTAQVPEREPATQELREAWHTLSQRYCADCHAAREDNHGFWLGQLEQPDAFLDTSYPAAATPDNEAAAAAENLAAAPADIPAAATWENIVRRLQNRQMPPPDAERPSEAEYTALLERLTQWLDAQARATPRPGRTETFRRLTRTEYRHAIRDLLLLDIPVATLLPPDEASHGFDNITVSDLSATQLNRLILAAERISRLAVSRAAEGSLSDTIRVPADVTQEAHVTGLPLGTRGGLLIPYTFPRSGEYDVHVRLMRDRNEEVEGLYEEHQLILLLDRQQVAEFTIKPPPGRRDFSLVDQHLQTRVRVNAGPHDLGVTFLQNGSSLLETKRQPLLAHFNMHRHPRLGPAVYQVTISGPFTPRDEARESRDIVAETTPAKSTADTDSPARRALFAGHRPQGEAEELQAAREILQRVMRRAYRRPVTEADFERPLTVFRQARDAAHQVARAGNTEAGNTEAGNTEAGNTEAGNTEADVRPRVDTSLAFEAGIEAALAAVLVSPHFLFRIERDPEALPAGTAYRLSAVELASRLSFFLWSSLPDERLLELAETGELHRPEVLEAETRRMLADPRAEALVTNFAAQWLYLRNLDSITPDLRLFPDFDDNLRQAFRRETELFFEDVMRGDRSVLTLLRADYTFLNERLAKHYAIPHITGSRWRRVELPPGSHRGGLLRHGSILMVTSYATRTSPVIRGHWILKNLVGTPPPPPPPDVPALADNTVSAALPMRAQLAAHRAHAACAGCHNLMDPVGFALENFDAVGRWRESEQGAAIDSQGGFPDGSEFAGVEGLEAALLARPESFVGTLSEKLLTYAVGRGLDHRDAPAIRHIVRAAAADDYRFSSLIVAIVHSVPFQMRSLP